uniref:SANT domain-containing protein n=1 Tax=Plectus sambesii TaxID=2011161 RepID=A0A914V5I4_9BILA
AELIEFYYLWKKTPQGLSQRPRQPRRRPQQATILRRIKTGPNNNSKPSRPASSEFLDFSSASENEIEESEAVVDLSGYACHHCYGTASKDWHHAGRDRALLCTDCRLYFKKYGELRSVDRPNTPPPYLFRSMATEPEFCDDYGVRTRAGKASANKDALLRRRTMTPTAEMESSRKSPSAASTSSNSSSNSNSAGDQQTDRKSTRKASTAANRRKRSTRRTAAVDDEKDARGRAKRKRT